MSLIDLIHKKIENNNIPDIKNQNLNIANAKAANFAKDKQATDLIHLEMVRAWLFKIGEPEADHFIVLEKCKSDPEALAYFLKHANGEF